MGDQETATARETREGATARLDWWMRLAAAAPRLHATLERDALLAAALGVTAEVTGEPAALFLLGAVAGGFEPFQVRGSAAAADKIPLQLAAASRALEEGRSVQAAWLAEGAGGGDTGGAALLLPLIAGGAPRRGDPGPLPPARRAAERRIGHPRRPGGVALACAGPGRRVRTCPGAGRDAGAGGGGAAQGQPDQEPVPGHDEP